MGRGAHVGGDRSAGRGLQDFVAGFAQLRPGARPDGSVSVHAWARPTGLAVRPDPIALPVLGRVASTGSAHHSHACARAVPRPPPPAHAA